MNMKCQLASGTILDLPVEAVVSALILGMPKETQVEMLNLAKQIHESNESELFKARVMN